MSYNKQGNFPAEISLLQGKEKGTHLFSEKKRGRIYFPDPVPLSGTINFGVMKCEKNFISALLGRYTLRPEKMTDNDE